MDPIRRDTRVGNARHRVPARLGGHAVGNWCLYKDAGVNYKPSVSNTTFRSLLTPVSGFRETAKSLRPSVATQKVRDRLDWVRFARALDVKGGLELIRLGSNYGGYVIPANVIGPDWICYSAGLGEDITFEIELAKRYGSTVYGFDPTPQSAEHVKSAALENGRLSSTPTVSGRATPRCAFMRRVTPAMSRIPSPTCSRPSGSSSLSAAACRH
jgi:hypothetical protein